MLLNIMTARYYISLIFLYVSISIYMKMYILKYLDTLYCNTYISFYYYFYLSVKLYIFAKCNNSIET